MKFLRNKNIYLDYAGSTPIDSRVLKVLRKYEKDLYANPSSIHKEGVKVRNLINQARFNIAKILNAHSDEIIFTGSGTESDALAILGVIFPYKSDKIPHIITTTIEHGAILGICSKLEETGKAEITYLSVNKNGLVDVNELKNSIKENTVLVSVMYANNEIGTIEPISDIAKIIRNYRRNNNTYLPFFHTDAAQAMNYLFVENVEKLGVDLLSFNGAKIYGPKGIGVLYKKRGVKLNPIYSDGSQEFGLRPGTENAPAILGIAEALKITSLIKEKESSRLIKIRDYGIEELLKLSKSLSNRIILNGDRVNRLPNNINISVFGISSELLVIELDALGFFVSSKSACKSNDPDASHVIKSIRKICRRQDNEPEGSLRISLGRYTTKKDIDSFINAFEYILLKYKKWK